MSPAPTPSKGAGPIARKAAADAAAKDQGPAKGKAAPGKGKPPAKAPKATKRVPVLDPDELAALEEQRDFLLRSIVDLDREHDAGDLEDDDYQTLKDDYTARAADVLRAIDERHAAFADARRPRSLGRTMAWVAGIAVFALVSGVMVANALGGRKAGGVSSGGITVQQTTSQKANDCLSKMSTNANAAYTCLQKVLDDDPENAVALAWSAWLLSLSADNFTADQKVQMQALAAVRLDAAVRSQPDYSYARAFRAVVAYRNGRYADAQKFLQDFEDNDPSADARQVIEQQDLKNKIATALADPASATTTTTAATTTTAGN